MCYVPIFQYLIYPPHYSEWRNVLSDGRIRSYDGTLANMYRSNNSSAITDPYKVIYYYIFRNESKIIRNKTPAVIVMVGSNHHYLNTTMKIIPDFYMTKTLNIHPVKTDIITDINVIIKMRPVSYSKTFAIRRNVAFTIFSPKFPSPIVLMFFNKIDNPIRNK